MIAVNGLFQDNYSGATGCCVMWTRKVGDGTETTVEQAYTRVGYRMTVVSSWGCLGLNNERRLCRLITVHEGSPPRSAPNLAHRHVRTPFLFSALGVRFTDRRRGHRSGDCPDKANHLAGDRCGDDDSRLAGGDQMAVALAHSQLPLPGDVAHGLGQTLDPVVELAADARLHPVAPRALNQSPSGKSAASLGNPTPAYASVVTALMVEIRD